MSERTLKRILAAVGVLVAAYVVVSLVSGGLGSEGGGTGELTSALDGLDAPTVEEAVFVHRSDTVRLSRSGGAWTVAGHPADSTRVAGLWSSLAPEGVDGPVAENPANHARLGVTADSARRVTFRTAGGGATTLLVGTSGPSFSSAYVRLEGSDRVFLLEGGLRTAVRRGVDDWRDRTIVRVDTAAVARLEITRADGRAVAERGEDGWTVDGEPAGERAVRDLLGTLAGLDATGFAPDTASLSEPDRRVVALDAAGDTLAALALQTGGEGSDVRVRAGDGETVYRLSSYRADRLTPTPAALRGEEGEGG